MSPEIRAELFKRETLERHNRLCWPGTKYIEEIILAAIAEEREACAKVAMDYLANETCEGCAEGIAAAIRARENLPTGETETA